MSSARPLAACVLLLATMVLAGCAGTNSAAHAKAAPETAVQGAHVKGRVVDDQATPVGNVTVALQDPKNLTVLKKTSSDSQGRFDLGVVAAGPYLVTASAVGYQAFSRPLTVASTQDQEVTVTLSAIPVAEAYYTIHPEKIHIDYGAAWSVLGDFNRGCIVPGATCQSYVTPNPNVYFWAEDPKDTKLQTVVLEESWTSTSPVCAKAMALDLYNPDAPNIQDPSTTNPHYWTNSPHDKWKTTSPIVMTIPRLVAGDKDSIDDPGRIKNNGDTELMVRGNWTLRHFPPGSGLTNLPADFNCFTDQSFDIYWSNFYLDPAPEGWTHEQG